MGNHTINTFPFNGMRGTGRKQHDKSTLSPSKTRFVLVGRSERDEAENKEERRSSAMKNKNELVTEIFNGEFVSPTLMVPTKLFGELLQNRLIAGEQPTPIMQNPEEKILVIKNPHDKDAFSYRLVDVSLNAMVADDVASVRNMGDNNNDIGDDDDKAPKENPKKTLAESHVLTASLTTTTTTTTQLSVIVHPAQTMYKEVTKKCVHVFSKPQLQHKHYKEFCPVIARHCDHPKYMDICSKLLNFKPNDDVSTRNNKNEIDYTPNQLPSINTESVQGRWSSVNVKEDIRVGYGSRKISPTTNPIEGSRTLDHRRIDHLQKEISTVMKNEKYDSIKKVDYLLKTSLSLGSDTSAQAKPLERPEKKNYDNQSTWDGTKYYNSGTATLPTRQIVAKNDVFTLSSVKPTPFSTSLPLTISTTASVEKTRATTPTTCNYPCNWMLTTNRAVVRVCRFHYRRRQYCEDYDIYHI